MKRLGILLLALAGLAALFASCGGGGEEEAATLAVAFRLDEDSPVMVAYIGDPIEDPFQLPAGRYYIEALDEDDALLSLGALDIEDGDAVEFPPSFGEAGGVADPQQAEPLITIASFLVDVELAKYEYLEIITGGFAVSPFDPSVERDEADFLGLIDMYGEIATQEDDVLGALDKIEGRAEVSLRIPYVRFPWAPAHDLKEVRRKVLELCVAMAVVGVWAEVTESSEQIDLGEVILEVAKDFGAHTSKKSSKVQKSEGLPLKEKQWQDYAKSLLKEYEMSPSEAQPLVETRIKSDVLKEFADLSEEEADAFAKIFVREVAKAVPELADEAAPAVAEPEEPEEPEEPAPEEPAEPEAEDPAEPEAEEPAEPEAEEPAEPEAEEPAEPEAEEPAPEGQDVTATGFYVNVDAFLAPGEAVVGNTITLRFNTGGGTVTGDGRLDWTTPASAQCPGGTRYFTCKYDGGTYDPESKKLSGACSSKAGHQRYSAVSVDDNGGWHWECESVSHGPVGGSIEWEATWEDGTIEGSHGPTSYQLKLTVQD